MAEIIKKWDASNYISDPEKYLKESLEAVAETGDVRILYQALEDTAKTQKMSVVAQKANIGRESLYKVFKENSKPQFETINKVINALGYKLTIEPC
ncbi:MAG TPA: putative addiction module antidote protein [Thiomicrospira sp.]|nr:putative addiction module antidote protein [Thiomicrospira sp.]